MKVLFLRFLRKVKVLQLLNFCFSVLVNDRSIKIPVVGGVGFANLDVTEKWMVAVMNKLAKNHGFTENMLKKVLAKGKS